MTQLIDPIDRVRAINPVTADDLTGLDTANLLHQITSTPPKAAPGTGRAATPPLHRRRLVLAAGAALTVSTALTAAPAVLPGRHSEQTPNWSWVPNAAAAPLDALASHVRPLPLGDQYLYVRKIHRDISITADGPGQSPLRYLSTSRDETWTGLTCNDRITSTILALDFPTAADQRNWNHLPPPDRQAATPGYTTTGRGAQLWESMPGYAHTDNPCNWAGTLNHPNPRYVAGLPDQPRALLDRIVRDDAALPKPSSTPTTDGLRNHLMTLLSLPWLSDTQRAATLRALGLLPGGIRSSGQVTVAGRPGLLLTSDEGGFHSEMVISTAAPGILRSSITVTDPDQAARSEYGYWPKGTVIVSEEIQHVAIVPTTNERP